MSDSVPLALHLSKVQVWMPRSIQALATHPDGGVVAVGREDGDVELVVPTEGYRVKMRVPGQKGKGLRSLVWLEGEEDGEQNQAEPPRLFGCGLDGTIFEVDFLKLCLSNPRDVYGGAAWCMRAIHSLSLLAVGCEDGTVRFFATEGGELEYKRSLPSTGSRVLSLAIGPSDDVLFAGCSDSLIHCFKITSGQSLFDMRLNLKREQDAFVWSLEALSDGTVISGDSLGRVQVWDGLTGTALQSLKTHEADVMTLCVTEDQTGVFASGCDGKVVLLERTHASQDLGEVAADDGSNASVETSTRTAASRRQRQEWEWSIACMRREHTHDVHALVIHRQSLEGSIGDGGPGVARKGPVLVSGGLDASLCLYPVPAFRNQGPRRLEPLPPAGVTVLSPTPRLVMIMHDVHIDIWEIPRIEKESVETLEDDDNMKAQVDFPAPRLRLRLEPKLEGGRHMSCAGLSPDGGLLAVSNTRSTKLYRLGRGSASGAPLSARRLRLTGACAPAAHALAFTPDSQRLILATAAGDIRVIELPRKESSRGRAAGRPSPAEGEEEEEAKLVYCFEELVDEASGRAAGGKGSGLPLPLPVSAIRLSACGKWMATASVSGAVNVFDLSELRHHWTIPSASKYCSVGMRFHYRNSVLVVVDSSNQFRLLDVSRKTLAEYNKDVDLPKLPPGRGPWGGDGDTPPLAGITFNPEDEQHSMLLFNHRCIMNVSPVRKIPRKVLSTSSTHKKRKLNDGRSLEYDTIDSVSPAGQSNFHAILDFDSIVLLDFLDKNELLLLQNPWDSVRDSLPKVIDRKQYGAS